MTSVLVIEDETQTRNIFLKCLEFEGFQALGASDGSTGMNLAQQHHPDLVVCDIMMPDMDGYAVLSALRRSHDTASIPLIFLTAKVTMSDLRQGMEMGADDYLTKPCTLDQFLAAIHTRLHRQKQLAQFYQTSFPPSSVPSNEGSNEETESRMLPSLWNTNIFPDCPHLRSVFQFIEAHYHQPITLNDVAQEAGYSPAYLTNLVQEQTGRSVKRWIIERRMVQAKHLLLHTTETIRHIAEVSGYGDSGYFARQFRQFYGVSPKAWRQQSVVKLTK
ncbi:MAG: response regulator [Elainellaceae cyanobacterium]